MILLSTQRAELIRKVNRIVLQAERQALENMSPPQISTMHSKMSSSSGFQQRSSIERGGIINNPKRQKPEATKKHFVNLSAQHAMLLLLLLLLLLQSCRKVKNWKQHDI
jgi:hypothetical protein